MGDLVNDYRSLLKEKNDLAILLAKKNGELQGYQDRADKLIADVLAKYGVQSLGDLQVIKQQKITEVVEIINSVKAKLGEVQ
jgi:hypothetical protein